MMKDYTVVIDTNLWISFLIKGFNTKLLFVLTNPALQFVYSVALIKEIKQTAGYQRLQSKINPADTDDLIQTFEHYFSRIEVDSNLSICRDPKDNYLLALVKDAQADFLITNDEDLLVLDPFENTRILNLTDFLSFLLADAEI